MLDDVPPSFSARRLPLSKAVALSLNILVDGEAIVRIMLSVLPLVEAVIGKVVNGAVTRPTEIDKVV